MTVDGRKLAELSQTIDPAQLGRTIRNARIAAGLTQSALAGDDASTAYLSRIESGQRRPGFALLNSLAQRLDVPLETLLSTESTALESELRLELDYAELALRSGNATGAMDHLSTVFARVDPASGSSVDPAIKRTAHFLEALAFESLGQLEDAILALEHFAENGPHDVEWMKASIGLVRCYRESGEFARAIASGERALSQVRDLGIEGTDESIQLAVTLASAYYEAGDVRQAIRICRAAIDQAEQLGSARAKASAYWNASILESEAGRVESAVSLAQRAISLLEREEDMRTLSRLESQLGMFLLRAQPPEVESAREHLETARRELDWSQASPIEKANNDVALARAHLLIGELEQARQLLTSTLSVADSNAPLLAADSRVLLGQVHAAQGDVEAARAEFLQAIHLLTAIKADRSVAQRWLELGNLMDGVGLNDEARDAYRRAAVSTGLTDPSITLPSYA